MTRGYDGTLRFDTKTDLSGFNKGAAAAGKSLRGIGTTLARIGKVIALGFAAALAVVAIVLVKLAGIVNKMFEVAGATVDAAGNVVGYGKKVEELKQTFANLKAAVTDAFRPLILAAMPWINAVAQALTSVLNMVAQVMASLTGQEGYWRTVTGAAEASGEATEKAEGALAAFDKINVLKEEDQGGGGGGGGSEQEWVPIGDEAMGIAEKIKEVWGKIKEWFAPVTEAIGRLKEAFGRLKEALEPVWEIMGERLGPVFKSLGEFVRDVLVGAIDLLTKGINWLTESIEKNPERWATILTIIGAVLLVVLMMNGGILGAIIAWGLLLLAIKWVVDNWKTMWEWVETAVSNIGLWFVGVWEKIKEVWATVAEWFKTSVIDPVVEFFSGIWEDVSGFFSDLWEDIKEVWNTVSEWFKTKVIDPIVNFFRPILTTLYIIFYDLWLLIKYVWEIVADWFKEHVVDPVVEFFKEVWTNVSGFFSDLWEDIKEVWNIVSGWFQENVTDPIIGWFEGVWTSVSTYFSNLWEDIKAVWETVSNWFQINVIDPVVTAWDTAVASVKGFFTGLWEDIREGAKTGVNWVIDILNSWLSNIFGGINSLIDKWNSIPIPGWLQIPPLVVPQIPRLAKGAVIPPNAEFLAVLGDQRSGRNIEAPEELIRQIVREETRRNAGQTGDIMANLTVNLDGETIWQNQQRISKVHGKRMVAGGLV